MAEPGWPAYLWIVRHGQSAGNVARDTAELQGTHMIDIADRDIDVPLSELGERQSDALGRWFATLPPGKRPEVIMHSPYVRAQQSAQRIAVAAGYDGLAFRHDERLREKEFGILDRFTVAGIRSRFPELAEQRAHVGKFYFRPPGGESWCDVILRLRGAFESLQRECAGKRVLIVAHQVTVNCLRYLVERLDERQILAIDSRGDVPNCSVTSYRLNQTGERADLQLDLENFVAPQDAATPVTSAADAAVAPKP